MSQSEPAAAPAITLEQLIALNDEIAALVRAGVPLEGGLAALGADLPGRLGRATAMLAERIERGESLSQALAQHAQSFPPVYRAVVEAGLRSGHLPVALEGLAGAGRRLAEARRAVGAAFVYPLIVFLVAWGLFVLFTTKIAPIVAPAFRSFDTPGSGLLAALARWGESAQTWGVAVPVVLVLVAGAWWLATARPALVQSRWSGLLMGWVPWTRRMLRSLRTATLAEVLALLVEHDVPLDEALELAGAASGDARTVRATRGLADAVRRGEPLSGAAGGIAAFPPLLRWLMCAGARRGTLVAALRHAAETYRSRALRQADMIRLMLPLVLTVVIGGAVVVAYALLLLGPWFSLLYRLAWV